MDNRSVFEIKSNIKESIAGGGSYEVNGNQSTGIAFGLDRVIALMAGTNSIRDVIAFPKNKYAQSLMVGSPSKVAQKQLDELSIKLSKQEK